VSASGLGLSSLFTLPSSTVATTQYSRTDFMNTLSNQYGSSGVTAFSGSPNCNTLGVMMSNPTAFCRFGIAFNNENDCATCDAWYNLILSRNPCR
jgi:hypothetical protein